MAEYRMENGVVYTENDIEQLAEACERGNYPGEPGRWIKRPKERASARDDEKEQAPIT